VSRTGDAAPADPVANQDRVARRKADGNRCPQGQSPSALFRRLGKENNMEPVVVVAVAIFLIWFFKCLNVLREYERAVVFRLGRVLKKDKGPGLIVILWPIDKIVKVSLRVVTWDVPPQDIITRDNVSLKVNAVVYFRVISATQAIIEVESFRYAVEQAAQTSLRSVLGEVELDDLLSQREKLNARLQAILDEHTEPWGIKVTQVQVKQVDLPQEMQRAIAAQAEAERERRAKIIAADGEFQAAEKLAQAAAIIDRQPATLTLRYLQTLVEIGTEKNTTIVFPLPIDLFASLMNKTSVSGAPAPSTST
jgi:regulator of protease activity HflC (stomatin/prohibitin superfamily)